MLTLTSCAIVENELKYREALSLIESGDYEQAYDILSNLGDYRDTKCIYPDFTTS